MQSIGNTLATLLGGNYINRFNLEGRSYQVIPQVPRGLRLSPEALSNYYVPTATGQQVPLSTLVTVETATDPNALTHYNQLNSATFSAVPVPFVTMGQAVDFLEDAAKQLPAGFSHDYLADSRQYVQEGNQLAVTFGFALIIIFLVLAAQFESLRDPLVILISVPMAICRRACFRCSSARPPSISIPRSGLLTLIGLISKHGILMVEFANELQLKEGLDRRSAIEMAARVRLRPILMTTAAMVTGLIPLLTATGAGAASRFSIGLVVVVGHVDRHAVHACSCCPRSMYPSPPITGRRRVRSAAARSRRSIWRAPASCGRRPNKNVVRERCDDQRFSGRQLPLHAGVLPIFQRRRRG